VTILDEHLFSSSPLLYIIFLSLDLCCHAQLVKLVTQWFLRLSAHWESTCKSCV